MKNQKFTDDASIKAIIKEIGPPETGNRIHYDGHPKKGVTGLGLRITAAGNCTFIFNYRAEGRERRYTIGPMSQWTLVAAREKAGKLARMVADGKDPQGNKAEARSAPTVLDLCQRFDEEHIEPKLRPLTARDYRGIINLYVLPELGSRKVADITYTDIDRLHRKITKRSRYQANRALAVLSKMFNLAIRWGWRTDHPVRGVERNQEHKRTRYLSIDELGRLTDALAGHEDQQAANIIRLLLLTGARRNEVQGMRWGDLDLERGVWAKPGAATKQKTEHRAPVSDAARQLLVELREAADDTEYVFPGRHGGHRVEIKNNWKALCEAADINGARIHDLRHTYASILASSGLSLPIIGALLGHTQAQTTQRYSHLFDDPLKAATNRAADIITGRPSGEVIQIGKGAS